MGTGACIRLLQTPTSGGMGGAFVVHILPVADWSFYLLGMTYAAVALWLRWCLFGQFLDPEKRVIGLAILTLIPFFNLNALKFDTM